jgi:glycosyltransferase involved in cell wall biosynthesis
MESEAEISFEVRNNFANNKAKILYVQPGTSSFAGIERVIDTVCSELVVKYGDAFDVDVLYTSIHSNRPKETRKYNVIDRITRGRVDLMLALRNVMRSKDYDLIVIPQIEPTVICMTACIGIRRNFAVYLHGNPQRERTHIKAKILFFLMKVFFLKRIQYVFGTSPKQLDSFRLMFNSNSTQVWLPNPVRNFDISGNEPSAEGGYVTFVNVGRFSFQKGQDILVDAFSKLRKVRQNVKLKIVGYGGGEAELRDQVKRLGLDAAVSIEHQPDSPQPALSRSDVYVSTSRWEGWSLAICEALRFGLPVISTDCEFGPSDILVDTRLGRLVPVSGGDELLAAMIYYCDNLQHEMSHSEFRKDFIDRFDVARVVDVHANALLAAAKTSW